MHFIHSPLAWGFALVAVPVLIHLINMMRHRRVKWAAMEFLLQSYRRHRTWVWLKQLLLLLVRMAAVAVVVAMLAKLVTPSSWTELFGGKVVHHYVVLDDSFSMSDRSSGVRAYDRAVRVIRRIAQLAATDEARHKLTLLRFSQAVHMPARPKGQPAADTEPEATGSPTQQMDIAWEPTPADVAVGGNIDVWMEAVQRQFDVSQLAIGPQQALHVIRQLLEDAPAQKSVVHIVSDFRQREWDSPADLVAAIGELEQQGAEIHLVRCVTSARPNLAITEVVPAGGTVAAGVPLFIDVTVKNFSTDVANDVQVQMQSTYFDLAQQRQSDPDRLSGTVEQLVVEPISRIEPGATATRRVQVWFPGAGKHVVEASLPDDPVAADNRRYCVVDFPAEIPVLVVDGDSRQRNAYFLASVFEPGGRVRTGVRPDVQDTAFLRDTPVDKLRDYHAVYLLDIDTLDARTKKNIEDYVAGGGGVGWFLGPNTNIELPNSMYRDGEGPFPVPLQQKDLFIVDGDDSATQCQVADHAAFRVFQGQQNTFLRGIMIHQFFRAVDGWQPDPQSMSRVIARLNDGQPLVVERRFGEGQIIAFLTTMSPTWNNWAQNPSFVVMMLDLQSHLAARRRVAPPRRVGSAIQVELAAEKYRAELTFVLPDPDHHARRTIQRRAEEDKQTQLLSASLGGIAAGPTGSGDTDLGGVYEAWTTTREADVEVARYALNVDAAEGDLALVDSQHLAEQLEPVKFHLHSWDELEFQMAHQAGVHWSELLLYVLVGLLLIEQALAYWSSYHVPTAGGVR